MALTFGSGRILGDNDWDNGIDKKDRLILVVTHGMVFYLASIMIC